MARVWNGQGQRNYIKKIDRTKTHKEMDKVKDDNSKLKLGITK